MCINVPRLRMLGFICLPLLALTNALADGDIQWESQSIRLEGSQFSDTLNFSFHFQNKGGNPVVFTQAKASCGCTMPALEKKEYGPGEVGELKGTYSLRGRHGLNNVSITVNAEELDGEVRRPLKDTLKLQVFIPEIVSISPGVSLWKKDSVVVDKIIKLEVKQSDALTLKLSGLSNDHFTAELVEDFPGRVYNLIVKPTSTAEPVQGMATIEAVTNDGKAAKFFAHFAVK